MITPLSKTVTEIQQECTSKGNKGLWFDRFFDQYAYIKDKKGKEVWGILEPEKKKDGNKEQGKSYWLIKHFHNKKVGNNEHLTRHSMQQKRLANGLQGSSHIYSADWHFVTGMGNPHPVENGFAWHPTLGVPYLTGAAVKGILRNYIENYLGDKEDKKALLFNWFGSEDKDPDKSKDSQTGNIIFFDALPVEPVTLTVDIMTPHMGKWYQDGGSEEKTNQAETVPADWHDPIPVTFLAAKDINLQFSFGLRQYPEDSSNQIKNREQIDLEDVNHVLTLALEYFGAGGKTATGYGSFFNLEKQLEAQKQIDEKKRLESLENWQTATIKKVQSREGITLEAIIEGKTANAPLQDFKEQIDSLSNSKKKKMKNGITMNVDVEKIGNSYKITKINL